MASVGATRRIFGISVATIQEIELIFPLLVGTSYSEESAPTDVYNCIAFAFGDLNQWWWPRRMYGCYWPPGFALNDQTSTLVAIFQVHGYVECGGPELERGYEKVVIYSRDNRFKHAARQVRSGRWASKLGEEQDIEHEKVEHIVNADYGVMEKYLRRKRDDWL
jgi:hypothetical protein